MGGAPRSRLFLGGRQLFCVFLLTHSFQQDKGPGKIKAIPPAEILQEGNDPFYKGITAQVAVPVGILPFRQVCPVGGNPVREDAGVQGTKQGAQVVLLTVCVTIFQKKTAARTLSGNA